jgi:four helix bundle protein
MDAEDFKTRTMQFALRIIRLTESLPKSASGRVLSGQLPRAGTSVGSNYRSACRARSRADFVAKMGIVEEECDESLYWMELLIEAGLVKPESLASLRKEGTEILSIVVSSIKTARTHKQPAPRTMIQ